MDRKLLVGCSRARRHASLIATVAVMLSMAETASAATACRVIAFQKGSSSAQVSGEAPANGVECLTFSAGRGQNVQVSVKSVHDQVAFSIEGLTDDRLQHTFVSEKKAINFSFYRR